MKPVHNLGRGLSGTAVVILPAVALALGTVGLVAAPVFDVGQVETQRDEAAERVRESHREAEHLEPYREATVADRARQASAVLDGLYPTDVEAIDLYGVSRLVAEAHGVELTSVSVSEPVDPELAVLDDWIALREVALRGSGTLDALPRIVDGLRALGFPSAVLDFTLDREDATTREFELALTLGVFQSFPASALESIVGDPEDFEDQGDQTP